MCQHKFSNFAVRLMLLGERSKTKVYEGTQRQQFPEIIQILGISSQRNIVGDNKKRERKKGKVNSYLTATRTEELLSSSLIFLLWLENLLMLERFCPLSYDVQLVFLALQSCDFPECCYFFRFLSSSSSPLCHLKVKQKKQEQKL